MKNSVNSYIIFNFCCFLRFSNPVGSSPGRQLHVEYGVFYMHRCEQSGGQDSVFKNTLSYIAYKTVSLTMNP